MKAVKKDQEVLLSTAEASGQPSPPTPTHLLLATHNWGPLRGTVRRALLKGDRLGLPEASDQGRREESGGKADSPTSPSPGQGPFFQIACSPSACRSSPAGLDVSDAFERNERRRMTLRAL